MHSGENNQAKSYALYHHYSMGILNQQQIQWEYRCNRNQNQSLTKNENLYSLSLLLLLLLTRQFIHGQWTINTVEIQIVMQQQIQIEI